MTPATRAPWPIGNVPWPDLTTDWYAPTRRNLLSAAGLESVLWIAGPLNGPVRFGSAADPRETWMRISKSSPVPVYVHDLRWAQGRLALRLARTLQQVTASRDIDPEAARELVDADSARMGIRLIPHADVLQQLDDEAPRAYARWYKAEIGHDFDPATIPASETPKERAAARRRIKRAHDRQLAEIARDGAITAEMRQLERLIMRYGQDGDSHS